MTMQNRPITDQLADARAALTNVTVSRDDRPDRHAHLEAVEALEIQLARIRRGLESTS
ncbi:hypothetical protein [Streptomyces sp. NPDC012510]|uniref:hypothetical protein n=1 Tax=Streptomyces sp. NPDC012510 TaxID=3364838 RepID=UPI0036F0421E